jgi:hypothetical protein
MATASVEGTVTRIYARGTGFTVLEEWTSRGQTGKRYWAVFPKAEGPITEGDRVKVSGMLGTKLSQDGRFVDHTVGSADVIRARDTGSDISAPVAAPEPEADVWNTPAPEYDASMPF